MNIKPERYKKPSKNYNTAEHIVFSCQYHVIFCPKYRRKILVEPYDRRLREIFFKVADDCNFKITDIEIMPDHVHMIIDCDPRFGVCQCIKRLKGVSARTLRSEYPELKSRMPSFWTKSYFVSTVGSVTLEVVKQYIANQKKEHY